MTWAVKVIEQNQTWKTPLRFVLLIMANRADEEGLLHPSVRWIMERTGLAESTVRDATRELQRLCLLVKEPRQRDNGGGQTSNIYRLAMGQYVLKLNAPPPYHGPAPVHGAPGGVHKLEGAGPPAGPLETKDKKKEKRKDVPLPDGFGISPAVREWAKKKNYETFLDLHLEYLVNWAQANPGDWCANWEARFRNSVLSDWGGVRKQAQIAARHGHGVGSVSTSTEWWKGADGVAAMGSKLGVERVDMVPKEGQREPTIGEQNMWFRARVCAAAGDGPWCQDKDPTFQQFLKVARERVSVVA